MVEFFQQFEKEFTIFSENALNEIDNEDSTDIDLSIDESLRIWIESVGDGIKEVSNTILELSGSNARHVNLNFVPLTFGHFSPTESNFLLDNNSTDSDVIRKILENPLDYISFNFLKPQKSHKNTNSKGISIQVNLGNDTTNILSLTLIHTQAYERDDFITPTNEHTFVLDVLLNVTKDWIIV